MDSKKFKRENFIQVQGFAIVDLKLSGNELLCYSLIYGFSQDGESEFNGSLSYVASALNITKPNAKAVLDRLIKKGLIEKRDVMENGVKLCRYQINNTPVTETITPPLLKQYHPVTETATNNNTNNILNNIDNNNPPINISPKSVFHKPTLEQVKTFVTLNGYVMDAEQFYDYYESNGWKVGKSPMKSWEAAVRNWVRNEKKYNNNGIYQSRQRQDSRRETPAPSRESISEDDWKF